MSQWWTYRLSDFLLFSARTYYRLFELYNAEVWPIHFVALALGLALVFVAWHRGAWAAAAACTMVAACWLWVAWAFHLERFTTINWAATWYAGAFVLQGALLLVCAGLDAHAGFHPARSRRGFAGWGLLLFALAGQPLAGLLLGRPWRQAEVFGLAPDPTTLATLGLLLLLKPSDPRRVTFTSMLWPIPLAWCLLSGATLWAMQAADAWLMPGAALLAVAFAWQTPRGVYSPGTKIHNKR